MPRLMPLHAEAENILGPRLHDYRRLASYADAPAQNNTHRARHFSVARYIDLLGFLYEQFTSRKICCCDAGMTITLLVDALHL